MWQQHISDICQPVIETKDEENDSAEFNAVRDRPIISQSRDFGTKIGCDHWRYRYGSIGKVAGPIEDKLEMWANEICRGTPNWSTDLSH